MPKRFYVKEDYNWEVWDHRTGTKALVIRSGVLYPADDFTGQKSAQRHADRLEAMVNKAKSKGASQEIQDRYWQYLD